MRIGIVGARLSGSYAALLLASAGHEVVLFDDSADREKPCGGGVTPKVLRTMDWFKQNPLPHNEIRYLIMRSPGGGTATLPFRHPLHIYSRSTLDSALREAAVSAGSIFVPERACSFEPVRDGWAVHTTANRCYEVEFLVGADGARSTVRRGVGQRVAATDTSLAVGYYIRGLFHPDRVVAMFQEHGFEGYLWSFPRVDHTSVGILQRLHTTRAVDLRRRVEQFIDAEYPGRTGSREFYAARIPCLGRSSLASQRAGSEKWALLGDAAGFADAITAEGIFYALRSAELLAQAFRRENPASYEQAWRADFGSELVRAAGWRDRFYAGTLLFHAFISRAVQISRLSGTVRRLTDAVVSGSRTYVALRRQLILLSPRILVEALVHKLNFAGRTVFE